MEINVEEELVGQRIDKVLTERLPDITRSQIKRMINEGSILVDGSEVKSGYLLRLNQSVSITPEDNNAPDSVPLAPDVIAETEDYVVINKPPGLTVHPASAHRGATLVDWLAGHYPAVLKIGDDPLRPGIVHRLDKDASGVMVIAKNQDAFESLKRQFKTRQVSKTYLILVFGVMTPEVGTINLKLARSKQRFTRMAASATRGREAVTAYQVERVSGNYSLVRVMPETGRTHQIRAHFFGVGHPIVGDPIYISKQYGKRPHTRLMLHASSLTFTDNKGEKQTYECPPDTEFEAVVADLTISRH